MVSEEPDDTEVLENVVDADDPEAEVADDSKGSEGDGTEDESSDGTEALDELEAEELEMLTEDESSEAIVVDEAAEMRAIRRAEIALEGEEASEAAADEFVCESCFLVLKASQRAPGRRKICKDCAA
jgi:erythromycin esterase-like protein